MDVKSSRKEFLICGTFKINSIEKMERERERESGREDSFLLKVFIQNILITNHYIIISSDYVIYYIILYNI